MSPQDCCLVTALRWLLAPSHSQPFYLEQGDGGAVEEAEEEEDNERGGGGPEVLEALFLGAHFALCEGNTEGGRVIVGRFP